MEAVGRIANPLLRVVFLLFFATLATLRPPLVERTGAWALLPEALIATLPFAVICAGIDLLLIKPRQAWRLDIFGPSFRNTNDFFAFFAMMMIAVGTGSLLGILLRHGGAIPYAIYYVISGASGLVWQYAIQRFIAKRFKPGSAK
jgi:hypothetical protein